jgi:hypothetical protein
VSDRSALFSTVNYNLTVTRRRPGGGQDVEGFGFVRLDFATRAARQLAREWDDVSLVEVASGAVIFTAGKGGLV